jgi:hypothetical protein
MTVRPEPPGRSGVATATTQNRSVGGAMRAAWVALLAVLAGIGPNPAHAAGDTLNHIIYCNGLPIGSSVLRFQRNGAELVVETDV